MTIKATMLLQATTALSKPDTEVHRTAGWSESWYTQEPDIAKVRIAMSDLCDLRARLLPIGASVVGQRYQVVDAVGNSTTGAQVFPGSAGLATDLPQVALYFKLPGQGVNNYKPLYLRGTPDARILEGEYIGTEDYNRRLVNFLRMLQQWRFRARDFTNSVWPIWNVTNAGVVQLNAASTLSVGNIVQVLRTRDGFGDQVGGMFRVGTVTNASNITLDAWTFGATNGGKVRINSFVYPLVDSADIVPENARAVMKKVGRPFGAFRGRASKRR